MRRGGSRWGCRLSDDLDQDDSAQQDRLARLYGIPTEVVASAARRAQASQQSILEVLIGEGMLSREEAEREYPTHTSSQATTLRGEGSGPHEPPSPPPKPKLPDKLGSITIKGELGRGGMGMVYLGHDEALDRKVVIKTLTPSLVEHEEFRARFLREARAAAKLDHPNIVTVHQVAETEGGTPYIVMQHVDGKDLSKRLKAAGPFPPALAVRLVIDAAAGVAEAHRRSVIHRDLKPSNLVLTREGVVKVLDFGTARLGDAELTRTGQLIGTLPFMPPEQAQGGDVDARADIYALGATLYCLLSGLPPYPGDSAAQVLKKLLSEAPRPLKELRPNLPPELCQVVARALARDPGERQQTTDDLIDELRALDLALEDEGSEALARFVRDSQDAETLTIPPPAPPPRKAFVIVGAAVAIIVLIATGALVVNRVARAARLRTALEAETPAERVELLEAFLEDYHDDGEALEELGKLRSWRELHPAVHPKPRALHTMAWDPDAEGVLLFSGSTSKSLEDAPLDSFLQDTWLLKDGEWRELRPRTQPPPRRGHAMVLDTNRGVIVLFGGKRGASYLNDTWEWKAGSWTRRECERSPPARSWHAMAYDPVRKAVVLFGGEDQDKKPFPGTWLWTGAQWRQSATDEKPPPRGDHAMAWDPVSEGVLLFGGEGADLTLLSDTWLWDGSSWTELDPPNEPPSTTLHAMVTEPTRGVVFLFGGYNNELSSAVYVWTGRDWQRRLPDRAPAARAGHRLACDVTHQRVILVGGTDGPRMLEDVWSFGATER